MRWMLDTDTCIELIRSKTPALVENLLTHQVGEVGVSAITVAELERGVERSDRREQNRAALEQFLLPLVIADFDAAAARCFGTVRAEHTRRGQLIGIMDTLIGAHALSLDAVVVSRNRRDFERIAGLSVEDWTS